MLSNSIPLQTKPTRISQRTHALSTHSHPRADYEQIMISLDLLSYVSFLVPLEQVQPTPHQPLSIRNHVAGVLATRTYPCQLRYPR